MKLELPSVLVATGIAASVNLSLAQDHGHLNVGAVGTNLNGQLTFDNGNDFVNGSGYVKTLVFTNGGPYAGYYHGNITVTALAATPDYGGPLPGAPALGSHIYAQMVSVEGPPGGAFAFWDSGATTPTISLPSGTTGTNAWRVSQNDGSPGTDPYGHFHGRRFTATRPGLYTAGFRAIDVSTNGLSNGPIHTPSETIYVQFQAGVTITSLHHSNNVATVRFGAEGGKNFVLEYTTTPALTNSWQETGGQLTGDDYLRSLMDENATGAVRFYRVKGSPAN